MQFLYFSLTESITEAIRTGHGMPLTALLANFPQQRDIILQETISKTLSLGNLDFLANIIDLSEPEEGVPSGGKVPFREVFRFCREWCEVEAVIRFGLQYPGTLVKLRDPCGRSALQVALVHGDVDLCRDILRTEPTLLQVTNTSGQTALHTAVVCALDQCVEWLLKAGADPGVRSKDGQTALTEAAREGRTTAVRSLTRHGAEVNQADRAGLTPLHLAVSRGHVDCVRALLEAGASTWDEETADSEGPDSCSSPLIIAVRGGHMEVVRALLEAGCNPSRRDQYVGWSALHYAVGDGSEPSCLSVLLACPGVDVDQLTSDGLTALMLAVSYGQCDMVAKLLKHPACRVDTTDAGSGMTALHRAADAGCHLCTSLLLEVGARPDLPDLDGATPLLLAVNSRHTHLMAELLQWAPGRWPWEPLSTLETTVLDIALKRGYWDIARLFLLAGWNPQTFFKSGILNDSGCPSIKRILSRPPSLKHISRLRFKANLGVNSPGEINCLPIPSSIKSYLLFNDLSNLVLHPNEQ